MDEKSVEFGKLRVPATVTTLEHELKNEEHEVAIGADILPTLTKFLQALNIPFTVTHSVSVRFPVDVKESQLTNIDLTEVALE